MYKFALDAVLKHEELLENQLQKDLHHYKSSLRDAMKQLDRIDSVRTTYIKTLNEKENMGIDVNLLRIYADFITRLSQDFEIQRRVVDELERECENRREILLKSMQKKKTLQKLEEKGRALYDQNLLKKEQVFLDEVAIHRVSGAH